ncbi:MULTISPECIES: helix-turn-helix domain-containing protein [Streptomyces]|uniref:helix-turn-helix domain-containing protein n=1 Tax=Streptomyces TaxID=1883 RepID=UPI0004BD6978|nr:MULTISPECIES: helix-turn-helix domain-containing protein [Streptomyces]KOT96767.1 AraC family transcriptional regulator [Streptomyces sp. NRRL F-4711]KOX46743.1 AraC family transcriptional regulator [Streptomyces sp. NRRL F-7442]MCL7365968.1 DJ-1/PfpI family protein [Streptomyces ardesiacus]
MAETHGVAVLAFDGMAPFELGVVVEVFGLSRPELGELPWYELRVCAEEPGRDLRAVGGFTLCAEYGLDALAAADTVIVPGVAETAGEVPPALVDALLRAHARGARLVSICSGAFALAATGLLDGRRATTHWRYARALAERHPAVEVDPDVLYVDNGDVLTSAGSAAGIDLCLYLVRADHGAAVANAVARRFVVSPHREGGQAQFIEAAVGDIDPGDDGVTRSMDWALRHLHTPLSVPALAGAARMSERSYARHFTRRNGVSPMRWVVAQRVAASLPLLESGEGTVDEVAAAVGFDSTATYRHHFTRRMRTTPTAYRKTFTRAPAPP